MTAEELRAITAQGPAIVIWPATEVLKLLDERDALRRQVDALRLLVGGMLADAGRKA